MKIRKIMSPEEWLIKHIPEKKQIFLFIISMCIGFLAHGYMFVNKIPNSDDLICLNSYGGSFASGRFFLGLLGIIKHKFVGNYSMPWFNGVLGLVFLSFSVVIVCDLFDVLSIINRFLIAALLMSFPTVAGYYLFMFTAMFYAIALWLTVCGAWCIKKRKFIWAIGLGVLGIAIYQSNVFVEAGLVIIYLIKEGGNDKDSQFQYIKKCVESISILIVTLLVYFGVNRIIMNAMKVGYSSERYDVQIGLSDIIKRLSQCYKDIYYLATQNYYGISWNMYVRSIYIMIIMMGIVYLCVWFYHQRMNFGKLLIMCGLVLALPVAINGMELLGVKIYVLMIYSVVLWLIFPVVLSESVNNANRFQNWKMNLSSWGMCIALVILICCYCSYDNEIYFAQHLAYQETQTYYAGVYSRIMGTEGYYSDLKLLIYGHCEDKNVTEWENSFEELEGFGYQSAKAMIGGAVDPYEFLKVYCGWMPERAEQNDIKQYKGVIANMNCYPDDGSIKIVDDVVILKLSE